MNANIGLVTRQMKEDFDACMAFVLPTQPKELSAFKQDLLDVVAEYGQEYAAQWIAGWRQVLEQSGATGHTGREIERRGLMRVD